jgi:hypothetical protein
MCYPHCTDPTIYQPRIDSMVADVSEANLVHGWIDVKSAVHFCTFAIGTVMVRTL